MEAEICHAPQREPTLPPVPARAFTLAEVGRALLSYQLELPGRVQGCLAEAENCLIGLLQGDKRVRESIEYTASADESANFPMMAQVVTCARHLGDRASRLPVQHQIDPRAVLLRLDASLAVSASWIAAEPSQHADALLALVALARNHSVFLRARALHVRHQVADFGLTPQCLPGFEAILAELGVTTSDSALSANENEMHRSWVLCLGSLQQSVHYSAAPAALLFSQEANALVKVLDAAAEFGAPARAAAFSLRGLEKRTIKPHTTDVDSWTRLVSRFSPPTDTPVNVARQIEPLTPLLSPQFCQKVAATESPTEAVAAVRTLDRLLNESQVLSLVVDDSLDRLHVLSATQSGREVLNQWLRNGTTAQRALAHSLIKTEENPSAPSQDYMALDDDTAKLPGTVSIERPRLTTPSGLLFSIDEQIGYIKNNSVNLSRLVTLTRYVSKLELPAEDFLVKFCELYSEIARCQSATAKPALLMASNCVREVVALTTDGASRLTTALGEIDLIFPLEGKRTVWGPSVETSRNGIRTALALLAPGDDGHSLLAPGSARMLLEQVCQVLNVPTQSELHLRRKLLIGGSEELTAAADILLAVGLAPHERQRIILGGALLYVSDGEAHLEELLRHPEQLSNLLIERTKSVDNANWRERVARALERFHHLIDLAHRGDKERGGTLASYAPIARRIRTDSFDAEMRRAIDTLRDGERPGTFRADDYTAENSWITRNAAKRKLLSSEQLPVADSAEGCLLALERISRWAPHDERRREEVKRLVQRLQGNGQGSSVATVIAPDQFLVKLFSFVSEHTNPLTQEERQQYLELAQPIVAHGRFGMPILNEKRGETEEGIEVLARKAHVPEGERTSTDGLGYVVNELVCSLQQLALLRTYDEPTPEELARLRGEAQGAQRRVEVAAAILALTPAENEQTLLRKLHQTRILPLDVVAAYIATAYAAPWEHQHNVAAHAVVRGLISIAEARPEIAKELSRIGPESNCKDRLDAILDLLPGSAQRKEIFCTFLKEVLLQVLHEKHSDAASTVLYEIAMHWGAGSSSAHQYPTPFDGERSTTSLPSYDPSAHFDGVGAELVRDGEVE